MTSTTDLVRYLDAVRQGDRHQAVSDLVDSRRVATDRDLLFGATALLTATVVLWSRRTGQSQYRAAADLCLAASIDLAA